MNLVAYARALKGLRQEDLAFLLGIGRVHLANVERGAKNPSLDLAIQIARELEQPVDELFNVDRASKYKFERRMEGRLHKRARFEVIKDPHGGHVWRLEIEEFRRINGVDISLGAIETRGYARNSELQARGDIDALVSNAFVIARAVGPSTGQAGGSVLP